MAADPISSATAAVSQITSAIRQAAQAVGTSFSYLLATAKVESNFDPKAKATTSSAQGLFQFIEQTWLTTMKQAGPALGYGRYANAIVRTPGGRMDVPDPAMRAEILNLRRDPAANAAMASAFTRSNAEVLTRRLGRAPSEGELYIAHFLGAGGAVKLIGATANSDTSAAELFPAAANANRSIFFDKQGRARNAAEVYANLTGRYDVARARSGPAIAEAVPLRGLASPPDTAATVQAFAANDIPAPPRDFVTSMFHALFHSGDRREAVAPRISQLWGVQSASQTTREASAAEPGKPLDIRPGAHVLSAREG